MRSNTSITGPTSMSSPVSSSISRATEASSVSPSSTPPPGRLQRPASGSYFRLTISTRPSWTITAPTPTNGRSGYLRLSVTALVPHHLDDNARLPPAVELGVEHLLPGAEVERAAGDRQDDLVSHECPLQVCVGVVLARLMMAVVQTGGRELLQPLLKIVDQAVLPVVDVHGGSDVHRRDEDDPFLHAALFHGCGDLVGDADELLPLLRVEPQIVGKCFHGIDESTNLRIVGSGTHHISSIRQFVDS